MKNPKNILLVEDNEYDQVLFIEALNEIENAILFAIAFNGKEALDILENTTILPDLIFTDINMPMMDGIECLVEIVKNPQIKHIPVIILSTDTRKVELVRELGAKAFIKKPNNYSILREQLEQMINLDFIADSHIAEQTFQTALSGF